MIVLSYHVFLSCAPNVKNYLTYVLFMNVAVLIFVFFFTENVNIC